MKTNFYILTIILLCFSVAEAQKPVTLMADSVKFGNRYFPGFWLTIPEANPEVVKANWIKTIEKGTKSKVSIRQNELTLFGAMLPETGIQSANIMSKTVGGDSITKLFVSVETERDIFIGQTSDEYEKLSTKLKNFAKSQYLIVAKEQLSAEESKLKELEKQLRSARKNKERYDKSIQSSEVNIIQQNDKITASNKELEILEIKINNNATQLSTMDDGDAKKSKKSELKTLQRKKKSLLKSINSAENSISKANTAIADNTNNIELNGATQKELTDNITQQKLTITRFQKKLKTIEAY